MRPPLSSDETPVPAKQQSRGPDITIAGPLGELLAAMWHQGVLRSRVRVSRWELWRARGYGVELFHDPADGSWSLIAVHHPWTAEPTQIVTVQKGHPMPDAPPEGASPGTTEPQEL